MGEAGKKREINAKCAKSGSQLRSLRPAPTLSRMWVFPNETRMPLYTLTVPESVILVSCFNEVHGPHLICICLQGNRKHGLIIILGGKERKKETPQQVSLFYLLGAHKLATWPGAAARSSREERDQQEGRAKQPRPGAHACSEPDQEGRLLAQPMPCVGLPPAVAFRPSASPPRG